MQPLKKQRPGFLEKMLERKIVEKYDSLEALAKAAGIKADALKAQVEEFNKVVQSKADRSGTATSTTISSRSSTVRGMSANCSPRSITAWAASSRTTTAKCSTCAPTSRSAISMPPGEATGGVHGAVRLGSVAILDCLVFGRLAGQKVAAVK